MKKTAKIVIVVTLFVAIGGWIASLLKKYNELEDEVSKNVDLIIGQNCYIKSIRKCIEFGLLSYTNDAFGRGTKLADEHFYNKEVEPAFDEWWNR